MNTMDNFSFILGSQIRYLVSNLSKKNFRVNVNELEHVSRNSFWQLDFKKAYFPVF